ncbi:uncharacterized protein LOC111445347 isoform X9 [Cucurbita moschata]|uniref:Uncharacterized protein LOC111445347 isoform X9 n=1 Tax=Cucurbita moschata TaxID=3662 RepID=A0A6J1FH68_CUCMO|nr:uncharacterized protein LOC111445347 isoform X9 [Cucurbita moschata]XP_022939444.1 uncharacterized protein LOC111445347 isoform X9 [Cucurbita moschata]
MAISAVIGWRIVFVVLACTMATSIAYTIAIDGSPFRTENFSRLMVATIIDISISTVAIATWISYKEPNWIASTIWIVFLVCLGSITTCAYILCQLWQLSSHESFKDIMYHVLINNPNKKGMEQHRKHSNVMIAKIIYSVLGCLMAVNLVYLFSDGRPFRKEIFTPWMVTTLIDYFILVTVLSVRSGCSIKKNPGLLQFFG